MLDFYKAARRLSALAVVAAMALVNTSSAEASPYRGTVRLGNRSPETLTVQVDGVVVGTVPPGATTTMRGVRAGYKRLVLQNQRGRVRATRTFFLRVGGVYSFTHFYRPRRHVPTMVSYAPASYGGFGSLHVMNRHMVPLSIFIDGRPRGRVGPSRDLILNRVGIGSRMLEARMAYPPFQSLDTRRVIIQTGVRQYANLLPKGGYIRVVNTRMVPVEVLIDGQMVRIVQPGEKVYLANITPGTRQLTAQLQGQAFDNTAAPIYAGQTYTWYLRVTTGGIRVVNRTPEPLSITIDGRPGGTAMPGADMFIANVPAGAHTLAAATTTGIPRQQQMLTVNPGETRAWFVAGATPIHAEHGHGHTHPHSAGDHHHHEHTHPHPGGLDHHHP